MRTMEDFVGVSIADSAEESRVRQRALQRVILSRQSVAKLLEGCIKDFECAAIECSKVRLVPHNMNGRSFLRARLCQQKCAGRKIECSEPQLAWNLCATLFPLKSSCNHQ